MKIYHYYITSAFILFYWFFLISEIYEKSTFSIFWSVITLISMTYEYTLISWRRFMANQEILYANWLDTNAIMHFLIN